MFVESAPPVMIEAVVGSSLAEVALDGRHALLQQSQYLLLVPADRLRIGKVEHGILVGHAAVGILHMHATLYDFLEEAVLGREIRQLPQTGVEAVLLQLLQHADGILEAVLGKLVVTLPVDTEPSCIEMDDVRGDAILAQLLGNVQSLLLREIGDTAHPCAKAPQRQHGRTACNARIFIEDFLGGTKEHEEVQLLVGHKQALGTDIRCAEVGCDRCRCMHKNAVATIREVERYGLILSVSLRSLRIGDTELNLLPHLIQGTERLTAAIDALARRQQEHRIDGTAVVAASLDERERQQLHLRRVVVDDMARLRQHTALLVLEHQTEGIALDLQPPKIRLVCDD